MADLPTEKGSALPPADAVKDGDMFFGIQDGVTKRTAVSLLASYFNPASPINVMSAPYNAKLDGVTDDSFAIQNAINAAPVGGTVLIPSTPTGLIATGLVVDKKLTIVSDGASVKQPNNAAFPILTVLSVNGFKLRGLDFEGNKANQTGTVNLIEIKNSSGFKVEDVKIVNGRYCGLKIESNTDAHPSRSILCRVTSNQNGYSGIMLYAASRVDVTSCCCGDNAGFGLFYDSSSAEAGSDISVTDGNFDYNGYEGLSFPYFDYGGLLGKCLKATVKGVSACNNGRNGITMQGKDKSVSYCSVNSNGISGLLFNGKQCSAVGNDLKYNTSVGIDWGDCEDLTCTGNTAIGNGNMGIEVNSCLRGVVSGNTVNGNNINVNGLKAGIVLHLGTGGYVFTGPTSGIAVTGNYVGPGPNQDYGIYLTNDSTDNVVDGNACVASGTVQDIRCLSQFNTVRPGASRAAHRGALNQITIASATSITIPDAQDVVFVTGSVSIATITGGNLSAGREITLVFDTSGILVITTGNILTAVTGKNWRPLKLTYIKSLNKWAIMDTTTF